MFVPDFKILSQVVSEKSLTEKKFTDRHTNIRTEKAKTIYPLYTSYTGGIINENHECFSQNNTSRGFLKCKRMYFLSSVGIY